MIYKKFLNVSIRGFTMFSKIFLLFLLSEYASQEVVVIWGLIWSMTVFSVLFLGFDLFHILNRDLVSSTMTNMMQVVSSQWSSYLLIYIYAAPLLLIAVNFLFDSYILAFCILLVIFLEHQCQEIYRILIVLNQQIKASILLFIRYGLWVWLIFIYSFSIQRLLNIYDVVYFWLVSLIFVLILSIISLGRFVDVKSLINKIKLNDSSKNLKTHLIKSWQYFASTLIVLFVITLDKYILNGFDEISSAYAYVLFFSIVFGIQNFLDPALFSFYYPQLIKNYKEKDLLEYKKKSKKLLILTSIFSLFLSISSIIFIHLYSMYIADSSKDILEFNNLLILIAISSFLYSISLASHFILYAGNQKNEIFNSSAISFLITIFICWFLYTLSIRVYILISLGLFSFMMLIMLFKLFFVIRFIKKLNIVH